VALGSGDPSLRIVVRCQEPQAGRKAQERLAAAGVEATALPGPPSPRRNAPNGEDILIVDGGATGLAAATAFAEAARASDHPPLAILAALGSETPPPSGLESPHRFDGAISLEAPPALLAAQISALTRMSVASEERARRIATAAAMRTAAPKPIEPRKLKALYIGAPSPIFLSLERALAQHGGLVCAAFTSFAGFDHLHDEFFDAVVLNGATDPATAISLCAALRRNTSLHHVPTMVVTAPGDKTTGASAIDRGASAVVAMDAPSAPALGWLFEAIRRERRRKAAEHDIRALRDIMGDPRTGLFRRAPFESHLARLADDHHASGRSLSLAALRVMPAHGSTEPSAQVWKRGFAEIASLSGRLLRDTDTATALNGDLIIVALPATDAQGARRLAERVASVAECTAFAAGEGDAGPVVFEQSIAELQPGESGSGLMARALRVFQQQSVTA
jgi:two-component system cell cycle response regulator PopA